MWISPTPHFISQIKLQKNELQPLRSEGTWGEGIATPKLSTSCKLPKFHTSFIPISTVGFNILLRQHWRRNCHLILAMLEPKSSIEGKDGPRLLSQTPNMHGLKWPYNYVPLVILEPEIPPTFSTILNAKRRFHLHPSHIEDEKSPSRQEVAPVYTARSLQKIINEMKTKRSESTSLRALDSTTNPDNILLSVLPKYCEYLRGQRISRRNGEK